MNQGNHWPLGSRFMSPEEVSAQLAMSARGVEAFSMTRSEVSASGTAGARASELLVSNKQASTIREVRPVNWFGRP
jgi:hypothetical protein